MPRFPAERTLTPLDHIRLTRLLERTAPAASTAHVAMQDLLASSDLVPGPGIPADVVTMYSQLLLANGGGGAPSKLTLCYPQDAQPASGFVSVLSPVGASLLGLRVGDVARWRTPAGGDASARILAVLFQPEASGDYTT